MRRIKLNRTIALSVFVLLFLSTITQANLLFAQETDLVEVQSKMSFDQTVEELRQMVAKNGMMVLSELNQGKILSMTGLELNAISLFVGNPNIGNKLFSADRGVGVAIPARINIYENSDGKTYVNYFKLSKQLAGYENEEIQKIAIMLDEKMAKLTGMLSN